MLFLIVTLTVDPASVEAVKAGALPCIKATQAEAGCLSYDLHESLSEPGKLVFVEQWEDRASLDAHLKADHLIAWREISSRYVISRDLKIIYPDRVEDKF